MEDTKGGAPLVSIVTAVYNGHPYFVRTLECVQAQTYPNVIHVVLDNASTDDTPDVIARAMGGRVPILTRRNPSLVPRMDNWNAAVAMTPQHARYVKLLAADDLMRKDCIERCVAVAESNPRVELVTAVDVFDDRVKPHGLDPARSAFEGREILRRLLLGDLHWLPNHHVFFRAVPERLVEPFSSEYSSDSDLVLGLLLQGQMGFVNAPLFYTRYHKETVTAGIAADGGLLYRPVSVLERYGHEVLSPGEMASQRKARLRAILRRVALWRATGQTEIANKNLQRLADLGLKPGALDYLVAILTWPPHKWQKKMREMRDRAVSPRKRITEADFLVSR